MNIELYINNSLVDFGGDEINIKSQIFDIYDNSLSSLNKSYTLEIPLTDKNKKIIGYINNVLAVTQTLPTGLLTGDGNPIIKGDLKILSIGKSSIKAIIEGSDWVAILENIKLTDIFSAGDYHVLNSTNVVASWSGSDAAYRYPLINYGATVRGSDNYDVMNFVPAWQIDFIIQKLLAYAKIAYDSNSWTSLSPGYDQYMLAPYKYNKDESWKESKGIKVQVANSTDNYTSLTHVTLQTTTITLNPAQINMDSVITNEASEWSVANNRMTATVAGTYRVNCKVALTCGHESLGGFTGITRTLTATLRYYDGSTNYTVATFTGVSGSMVFNGSVLCTLDSGYIYMAAGGYMYITINASSQAYNSGTTRTVTLYTTNGTVNMEFNSALDLWCQYPGEYFTQRPQDYMPDISGADFLRAVKQAFGLIYWFDSFNNKLYAQTYNDYFGSTVIDWTDRQDYSNETDLSIIASSFKKNITLKYKPDTSDIVYNNQVSNVGVPFKKDIVLTSLFANPGTDIIENSLFAPLCLAYNTKATWYYTLMSSINGSTLAPDYRPKSWGPRIGKWTPSPGTGERWYFYDTWNDISPTTYNGIPDLSTVSMATNYDLFSKLYYTINNKKALEVVVKMNTMDYQKFQTVLTAVANEGFRALYKLEVNGEIGYFYITSIVFDGKRAKLQLIQK
jgi:hypothetical protein